MTDALNVPDLAFAAFLVALGGARLRAGRRAGSRHRGGDGARLRAARAGACSSWSYGAVLGVRAAFAGRPAFPEIAWRPLLLIAAAVALFALLLPASASR